ncbi:ATP-dependent Lon protease [Lachnospiraceae bacterium RM5]|nr:ATP-dependent Lon protease [Lachnospiraceae bacterium RM5]
MRAVPVFNTLFLPDITFYFKVDIFEKINIDINEISVGDKVLMAFVEDGDSRNIEVENVLEVGMLAVIKNIDPDGTVELIGESRVKLKNISVENSYVDADYECIDEIADISDEEAKENFIKLKKTLSGFAGGMEFNSILSRTFIVHLKSYEELICAFSGFFDMNGKECYEILKTDSRRERYELIEKYVYEFIEMYKVHIEAENAQQEDHEQLYRESAIKKQIEILESELEQMHPENATDTRRFTEAIFKSEMNEEAKAEAVKVLKRMKNEGKDSHEYGMLYDYLEFMTTLSWKKEKMGNIDLAAAREILDKDHYGLEKIKKRVIEQMAVMALNKKQSGSILLFVGPPGTGKTSIGKSIAKALDRKYIRISLGGIRDEAEIRGHRRTYIGAMPGRIMEGIKGSGVSNPVIVLDEVDKLVRDFNGDPGSALLEVLDPEQNNTFTDHYLNVPYDLSDVLFICTANTVDTIPLPLLNRMEVIEFSSYTEIEKFYIAKKHLIPEAYKKVGLSNRKIKIEDSVIKKIINEYTLESGVRNLKKQIESVCRSAAVKIVMGEDKKVVVNNDNLDEFIGKKIIRHDVVEKLKIPGIVTGLAWTSAGGEILFIETKAMKGSGKIIITGQLGEVMKESVQIALTLVKSFYPEKIDFFNENDIHIHVPEGAVPKDGPSAGITLVTALSSLVTGKAITPAIAMTGEVSLKGYVMPIGGLTEKLMAARRSNVKRVFIPKDNEEDLKEIPQEVKDKLKIETVDSIKDLLLTLNLLK